jgi:hypothetical protein
MTADSGRPDVHERARFSFRPGEFVRVAGPPMGYTIERKVDARRIDHLIIQVRAGGFGLLEIALNTYSLRSLNVGSDPRLRVAVVSSHWSALPPAGVSRSGGLNYSTLEVKNRIVFQELARSTLEFLMIEKLNRSQLIEGWGEFYLRVHSGIHQVHSRRASRAVPADYLERDGAIRFYFKQNGLAELLLFKFCGQA